MSGPGARQSRTVSETGPRRAAEVPAVGVAADEEGEADRGHGGQRAGAPGGGADGGRRQVGALGVVAGEAEGHGQDGEAAAVVEGVAVDAEPVAEAVAGGVVEGAAERVHAGAGGLAAEEDRRGRREPGHRPRRVGGGGRREARGAEAAGADFVGERGEGHARLPASPGRRRQAQLAAASRRGREIVQRADHVVDELAGVGLGDRASR